MTNATTATSSTTSLRAQAVSRLAGGSESLSSAASPVAALEALYHLASSADTAPRALALLHELQVHQVELELQDDELRRSRTELEDTLRRQMTIYDYAPMGYFTVDADTTLFELNLTGAHLLGVDREALVGSTLAQFLTLESVRDLKTSFAKLGEGVPRITCGCVFRVGASATVTATAAVSRDPDGSRFLVALSSSPL